MTLLRRRDRYPFPSERERVGGLGKARLTIEVQGVTVSFEGDLLTVTRHCEWEHHFWPDRPPKAYVAEQIIAFRVRGEMSPDPIAALHRRLGIEIMKEGP